MKTLKLPKGSLRQQLQDKICKTSCQYCSFRLNGCTLTQDIINFWKEWLEQKRKEFDTKLPKQTIEYTVAQWKALTELLEDLKE